MRPFGTPAPLPHLPGAKQPGLRVEVGGLSAGVQVPPPASPVRIIRSSTPTMRLGGAAVPAATARPVEPPPSEGPPNHGAGDGAESGAEADAGVDADADVETEAEASMPGAAAPLEYLDSSSDGEDIFHDFGDFEDVDFSYSRGLAEPAVEFSSARQSQLRHSPVGWASSESDEFMDAVA